MRELSCPHCGHSQATAMTGAPLDCTACGRSFLPPQAPVPGAADPRAGVRQSTPTDVPLALSGLAAVGLSALFYAAVVYPLADTPFGQIFGARGWVPYVIALLAAWSGVMLAAKYRTLTHQRQSLAVDVLPLQIADRITPENAGIFVGYVRNLPQKSSESFLIDRVERALQHFRARPRVQEVVDQLASQAQADANAVDSSYTMLRVFIWAVPILGFIGTVMGIGAAVGAFSESVAAAGDLAVMKNSIGSVTTGLGVAFDTTLLALIVSLCIMFPTSSLQKAEETFLAAVEDYCSLNLVRRLEDGAGEQGGEDLRRVVSREIARQLDRDREPRGDGAERLAHVLERIEEKLGSLPGADREGDADRDDAGDSGDRSRGVRPLRRS